jgi:Thaumarchaeal output domain 1
MNTWPFYVQVLSNFEGNQIMTLTSQSIKKPFDNIEIAKLLESLRERNRSTSKVIGMPVRLKPSFHQGRGFLYPDIQLTTLEEQIRFLEVLERTDTVSYSPTVSLMQCPFCNSHRFCSTFTCKLCKSPNILRGSAIVHEPCGNVDFYYKYATENGTLLCHKCNKNLKAIGVDYSRLDGIYNCLNCKSMLSDIDQLYKCLDCGNSSTLEESRILSLDEYVFDIDKLTDQVKIDKSMLSIIKELDTIGIKVVHQGAVMGASRITHIFSLVAYAKKVEQPFLVADVIETDHRTDEMRLLSFIGKCVDSRIENRIIVAIPNLQENLRELINTNGIKLVELRAIEDITFELVKAIEEIYHKVYRD